MIRSILVTLIFTTFLLAKPNICVSIPPQAFFIQKIAGDLVKTTILIPPGASPATFTPKPSQLKAIKESRIYFTIGVPFETNWLDRFKSINPDLKVIDTTQGISKLPMPHEIGHEGENHHEHGTLDPHVWLSPTLVEKQAAIIKNTLSNLYPKQANIYENNYQKFLLELHLVQKQINNKLSHISNRRFIVFHPSFGYFAKDFNLTQVAIEKEGKEPSLKYIKQVIEFAHKKHIKTIFVEPQFSQKSARYIAKHIGGNVVTIDPLAKKWDTNLMEIAKSFEKAD